MFSVPIEICFFDVDELVGERMPILSASLEFPTVLFLGLCGDDLEAFATVLPMDWMFL